MQQTGLAFRTLRDTMDKVHLDRSSPPGLSYTDALKEDGAFPRLLSRQIFTLTPILVKSCALVHQRLRFPSNRVNTVMLSFPYLSTSQAFATYFRTRLISVSFTPNVAAARSLCFR